MAEQNRILIHICSDKHLDQLGLEPFCAVIDTAQLGSQSKWSGGQLSTEAQKAPLCMLESPRGLLSYPTV